MLASQGRTVIEACRIIEVSEQTYYRWRKEYGGMDKTQARKLKPSQTISRPLCLIKNHAYAATWLPVRITSQDIIDKKGKLRKYSSPKVEEKLALYVIRNVGLFDFPQKDIGKKIFNRGMGIALIFKPVRIQAFDRIPEMYIQQQKQIVKSGKP